MRLRTKLVWVCIVICWVVAVVAMFENSNAISATTSLTGMFFVLLNYLNLKKEVKARDKAAYYKSIQCFVGEEKK